ncbi:LysM peptidoglycan-binding domain-containing protein [Dyadobacter luteus]|jgi:membrane-bound lytic murein transglycosylase D|nr:LysM peptidoglycan-binding domain-containing protein [Dyadobacter luteus]
MTRIFIAKYKIAFSCWAVVMALTFSIARAQTPDIPASVSFGGITVKFDRSAQNLIQEDIKNLMSNKKFWEEKMERAILHFPIVESILMDEEVPIDFKYLAVQESSFRPDVVSSSNAVGYWQFKPETAVELNLRVDKEVDERKNISSSTHAAAWYLKKNNQQFNNWVSSLYSYYLGAGGVKKVVPANWAYAREVTLNGKTDRYMLRFFAHKIALEAGIEKHRSTNKIVLLESEYGKGQSFDEIGKDLGINSKELESYNKWVNTGRIPTDREYLIAVPVPLDQVAVVREKLSLPAQAVAAASAYDETGFPILKKSNVQSSKSGHNFYEINGLPGIEALPGDKPKTIAKAGNLRMTRFMRNNDMVRDMPLIPGNVYYLAKKNKKAATPFHTARPGDTWHSVSQQYGVRLVSLLNYNRTISRNYPVQTGQVLWLTKKRPKKQPIEIIKPETPTSKDVVVPVIAENTSTPEKTSTTATQDIPVNAAGRKKYTPVLVEKSESSIAKEQQQFEPAVTPTVTVPVVKPAVTASDPNDRVVIITQGDDNTFKSGNGNTADGKKAERPVSTEVKSEPATNNTSNAGNNASNSVYARKQREIAERNAAEKAAAEKVVKTEPVTPANAEAREGIHIVKSGETYYSIARKYGMNVSELTDMNSSGGRKGLMVGQRLRIKDSSGSVVEAEIPATPVTTPTGPTRIEREAERIVAEKTDVGAKYHTVQPGETYYSISRTYGISLNELMALNNMTSPNKLISGQQLKVGTGAGRNAVRSNTPQGFRTHTVASGETLFRISVNYGVEIEEIKRLNNISGNNVSVGQKLKIPQK